MSRRGLLYAGAAAAHAGEPDAALLSLCSTFHRTHAEASDKANPYRGWAASAKQDTLKQLYRMVPTTEAGHRAKAKVAARVLTDLHEHETRGDNPEPVFAAKALGDWLGLPA